MDTPSQPRIPHDSRTRAFILAVLVALLILLAIGLYLWGRALPETIDTPPPFTPSANREPETPRAQADIQILRTVSNSDELTSIDADLGSTHLEGIDAELELIERDLGN